MTNATNATANPGDFILVADHDYATNTEAWVIARARRCTPDGFVLEYQHPDDYAHEALARANGDTDCCGCFDGTPRPFTLAVYPIGTEYTGVLAIATAGLKRDELTFSRFTAFSDWIEDVIDGAPVDDDPNDCGGALAACEPQDEATPDVVDAMREESDAALWDDDTAEEWMERDEHMETLEEMMAWRRHRRRMLAMAFGVAA